MIEWEPVETTIITPKSPEGRRKFLAHDAAIARYGVEMTPTANDECRYLKEAVEIWQNKTTVECSAAGRPYIVNNYHGVKGADVFARCAGGIADTALYPGPDRGWDVEVNGQRVDVKNLQRWLIFDSLSKFEAPIAALVNHVWGVSPVVVAGWITREEFERLHFLADFGRGPRLCVTAAELHPMTEFPRG